MREDAVARFDETRRAEVDRILRSCIHCGLCNTACPTYALTSDEREGPRGRIDMIRHMFDAGGPPSAEVRRHLDNCLPCWSCMTSCPSHVDIRHLTDLARMHIRDTHRRPFKQRVVRDLLGDLVASSEHLGLAARAARFSRPLRGLLAKLGWKEVAGVFALAPSVFARVGGSAKPAILTPKGARKARVTLFFGCTQQALRPEVNEAAIRLLTRHGVEVVLPSGQQCCGAIDLALGNETSAHAAARDNVDIWTRVMRDAHLDAIVTTVPSCGARIKGYGSLLGPDQGYTGRAERVGSLTCDITEFLSRLDLDPPRHWSGLRVAHHMPCALRHGMGVTSAPGELLCRVGYTVLDVPGEDVCCGAAGAHNVLNLEMATRLLERTMRNIDRLEPDIIVTDDVTCLAQLASATPIPVVHTLELIDWTLGGPCPKELESLQDRVHKVGQGPVLENVQG
jgi:glycolate oxidase iron-sulfur subunit